MATGSAVCEPCCQLFLLYCMLFICYTQANKWWWQLYRCM